ncbi:MAG: thiamine biosynthesis protein ThiS [Nitrospirae bacterium RBG_16_64_22]|nr:MAG: thiamine biosynthesis protein ThiS [Nitrospirae bacterium RBG_16_64_22]
MMISLNGQKETCDDGATIASLLQNRNVRPEMVSVEVNDSIIERGRYDQVRLKEGDSVELLYFMGGGS